MKINGKLTSIVSVVAAVSCGSKKLSENNLSAHPDKSITIRSLQYEFERADSSKNMMDFFTKETRYFRCDILSAVGDETNQNQGVFEIKLSSEADEYSIHSNERSENLGFTKFARSEHGVFGATAMYSGDELRLFIRPYGDHSARIEIVGRRTPETTYEVNSQGEIAKVEDAENFKYGPYSRAESASPFYVLAYGKCAEISD